jgi:hypothetical protein
MKDIIGEVLLVLFLSICVGTCSMYYAGKADRLITQKIAEAMEVRR